jgi:hypothetical protein
MEPILRSAFEKIISNRRRVRSKRSGYEGHGRRAIKDGGVISGENAEKIVPCENSQFSTCGLPPFLTGLLERPRM